MSNKKLYTVELHRRARVTEYKGTIDELIEAFSYTLECGKCYEHERGNKKINMNPKGIKSLVTNLNNATNNSAQNGYSENYYTVGE